MNELRRPAIHLTAVTGISFALFFCIYCLMSDAFTDALLPLEEGNCLALCDREKLRQEKDDQRTVIYFQPLEEFPAESTLMLYQLENICMERFRRNVTWLDPLTNRELNARIQLNGSIDRLELQTQDVLTLLKERLPEDGYIIIGLTRSGFFPDAGSIYDRVSYSDRVGVFSFAGLETQSPDIDLAFNNLLFMSKRGGQFFADETRLIGPCVLTELMDLIDEQFTASVNDLFDQAECIDEDPFQNSVAHRNAQYYVCCDFERFIAQFLYFCRS